MKIDIKDEYGLDLWGGEIHFELEEGLVFLAGCNGGGKTSTLKEIQSQFKANGIKFVSLDARYDFHPRDLNDLKKCFSGSTLLANSYHSEHESYEHLFYEWVGSVRPGDEYRGQSFGFFIDGLDSGGDVYFYQQHLDFFEMLVDDCKTRGITPYLVVTCNNFYYLSKSKIGKILFVPTLRYASFYDSTQYDKYVQDILETAKSRGFIKK